MHWYKCFEILVTSSLLSVGSLGLIEKLELLQLPLVGVGGVPDDVERVSGSGSDPQYVDVGQGLHDAGTGRALLLLSHPELSRAGGRHAGYHRVVSRHDPALTRTT